MKAPLVLIFVSFLLPSLVAEDEDCGDAMDNIVIDHVRVHGQAETEAEVAAARAEATNEDDDTEKKEASESSASSSTTLSSEATNTVHSQRIREGDGFAGLPPYRKHHHYHGNDGGIAWAPHVLQHTTTTATTSSNHNVVIPPYRPFSMSTSHGAPEMDDGLRLSLEHLVQGTKQQQMQAQRRRRQKDKEGRSSNETQFPQSGKRPAARNVSTAHPHRLDSGEGHHVGTKEGDVNMGGEDDKEESVAPPLTDSASTTNESKIEGETLLKEASDTETEKGEEETAKEEPPSEEAEQKTLEQKKHEEKERVVVDYAGKSAGALVIEKSSGWKGTSNLLTSNEDAYAMVPASEENKSFIISLSEEIRVKKVVLSNYERYSCNVKEFSILGSQTMAHWAGLGSYTAAPGRFGRQEFELPEEDQHWARYLKFKILSHHGDEHYLTITQISVHGTTMQQGFHEHWEEHQKEEDEETDKTQDSQGYMGDELQQDEVESDGGAPNKTETTTTGTQTEAAAELVSHNGTMESLIEEQRNETLDRAGIKSTKARSFRQARGIDENGYLLYYWFLPQPRIEEYCQWTALPSASVTRHSTAVRTRLTNIEATETLREAAKTKIKIPAKNISLWRRSQLAARKKNEMVAAASRLPNLVLEDSLVVSQLLKLIQARDNTMTFPAGEIKGRLVRTHRVPPTNGSSSGDEPQPETNIAAENETRAKAASNLQDGDNSSSTSTSKQSGDAEDPQAVQSPPAPESALPIDSPLLDLLLQKVPSAICLRELNITQYKSKLKTTQKSSSNTGSSNNGPSAGGTEPIFKKLTDEIKSLQAALGHHEKYAKDAASCYQRVLFDLLLQAEQDRLQHDKRLEHLEKILSGRFMYSFICDVVAGMGTVLSAGYYYYIDRFGHNDLLGHLKGILGGEFLYSVLCDLTAALGTVLSTGYYYYISESLLKHASEIRWEHLLSWFSKQASFSSLVGFPVSVLCMVLYRYGRYHLRNQAALRAKLIQSTAK